MELNFKRKLQERDKQILMMGIFAILSILITFMVFRGYKYIWLIFLLFCSYDLNFVSLGN